MYYVTCLIQNEEDKRAWRCASIEGCTTLDEAKEQLEVYRDHHNVIAAWIEDYLEKETKLRFFKCYVDVTGYVRRYKHVV